MKKIIFLFCIFLSACNDERNNTDSQKYSITDVRINPLNGKNCHFSNIFDSTHFIKLDSKSDSFIGEISEIIVKNDRIFIKSQGKILIFDIDGSFITSIGKRGKGPGEHLRLQDFLIDSLTNNIEILDSEGRKILYFDASGNYIDYWKTDLFSLAFTKLDDDTYAFYCGNDLSEKNKNKINILSKSKNIRLSEYFPIDLKQAEFLNFYALTNFSEHRNNTSFTYSFNDTIFQFEGNSLKPKLLIDFGEKRLPQEFLDKEYNNVMEFVEAVGSTPYAYRIMGFFETDNTIVFGFRYLDKLMHAYYSKSTGNIIVADKLIDDLSLNSFEIETSFYNLPRGSSNSSLFYTIHPYDFIATIDSVKSSLAKENWQIYKNNHAEVMSIYDSVSIDDNPIIVIRKTKAF